MPTKKKKVSWHDKPFPLFSSEDVSVVQRTHHVVVGMSVSSAARAALLSSRAHKFGAILTRSWRTWRATGEVRAVFRTMDEVAAFEKSCKKATTARKPKAKAKVANG